MVASSKLRAMKRQHWKRSSGAKPTTISVISDPELLERIKAQAAGFKAVTVYSREDLARILTVMELPEPDL